MSVVLGEAQDVQNRPLSKTRAAEIALELAALMEASRRLGAGLNFDDQASDYARALVETSEAGVLPK